MSAPPTKKMAMPIARTTMAVLKFGSITISEATSPIKMAKGINPPRTSASSRPLEATQVET